MEKKWLIISLVFVLAIIATVVFGKDCLAQGKVVGLLWDGYQRNCKVLRNGKEPKLAKGMELFEGDIIIKTPNVKDLKIQFSPFRRG